MRTASLIALLSVALLASLGCGRKATREDCDLIVDKNVEVKLKSEGMTDPAIVGQRKLELRESLKGDIDRCVGKRVTNGMLACVQKADTPEAIDKCLR